MSQKWEGYIFDDFIFNYTYFYLGYVHVSTVSVEDGGRCQPLNPLILELEAWAAVSYLMWVLTTKLTASARAANVFDYRASPPTQS